MSKYTEESKVIDVKSESEESYGLDETINETNDINEIFKCTFTFILVATIISLVMYLILNSYAS